MNCLSLCGDYKICRVYYVLNGHLVCANEFLDIILYQKTTTVQRSMSTNEHEGIFGNHFPSKCTP